MIEIDGIKVVINEHLPSNTIIVSKDLYEKIIKPTNTAYFSNINQLDYNDIPEAVQKEKPKENHSFKYVKKRNEFFNRRNK
jgi:hypothetical protein